MGSPALIGFEMGSREKAAREDEQRQAQLQNITNAGLSPEQQRDAIQQLYAKDPSALKRHVENLFGRLVGRKAQPVAPAYAPQSVTTQAAPLKVGNETLPAPAPVTVNYPGAKTHAERLAQDLSGGKTKEQQALDLFNQESAAQEDAKLSRAQKMFQWYQGLTPEQQRIAGPMLGIRTPEDLKLYRLSTGQTVYLNAADPASIPAGAEPVATGAAAQGPSLVSLGGVPMAVKDPQTGKTYSKQQIEGGNVPEDVAALWKSGNEAYQTAQTTKQKQFDREQQAILKRQEISNNNMLSRMAIQFRNMLSAGSFRAATATVEKLQQAYSTSVTLDARMKQLEPEALKGNQQAMLAILANHIAMTTHQPGAAMRPTKELFDEAAATQPWMQKITKRFDANGVLVGVVLSPEQIKQMVGLAPIMVQADKDALEKTKSMLSDALNPQFNDKPAPKKPSTSPIVQFSPSTKKYRYSTDGGKTWQPGKPPQL